MQSQISSAKNKLIWPEMYAETVGSPFEEIVAEVYKDYTRELLRMNAMDYDDLLLNAVRLLEKNQEVRDRYANQFRWVMVDEYQDTNAVQYRWLQLLTSEHRNLAVVGDDAQCLVAGTPVTMADGSTKPIEEVEAGDEVLSSYGSSDFRPARVTETFESLRADGCRDRDGGWPADRQHARAHAFRGLRRRADAASAPDVPDVARRQGLPGRDDADTSAQPTRADPRVAAPLDAGARRRRVGAVDA